MATNNNSKTLGPLRSEITFILHTKYAHYLWTGRRLKRDDKGNIVSSSILSIPNCLGLLSQIQRDASENDPYADDYLLQFEEKVLAYREEMQKMTQQIVSLYVERLPENFEIERSANISPVSYAIHINSQLGYQLLYLLGDYDGLARAAMIASHLALITRGDAQEWLEEGAKLIRQCFGIIEHYKHSGITRQDAAENNARYQAAIQRMGYELPPNILSGELRADFAPVIKNRRSNQTDTADVDIALNVTE
ncbi:TIGR03761 family integrating conjugative element protein [Lonepinella koalarum]|uniref:PFL_4669 family integrating conjugative element protein n=1 Tax=Lonepinella koalarum TaxID=53417 RepID=UPI0011E447C4|nr:TIGR03761 family integrating conjugative element protein [Lonepinella koalarum]TYG35316.1 TIGR03761 family integrating conjugative element protein [Lonepinella koalarum]